jgi:hypothetical protein
MLFILQGWKYSKWAYSCIFAMYTLYSINCHNVSKAIKSTIPKFAIFLGGIPTINLYGWLTLLYGRYRVSSRCFQQITIRVIALLSLDFPHKPFLGVYISLYPFMPHSIILWSYIPVFLDMIPPKFVGSILYVKLYHNVKIQIPTIYYFVNKCRSCMNIRIYNIL